MAGRTGFGAVARTGYAAAAVVVAALVAAVFGMPQASADVLTTAQSAAAGVIAQGYRTGIAVLDLRTGEYAGAGEDTASFASESVVKVLIATELLATDQMTGDTATTAYQMITESDDDDADALYDLVGGDNLINLPTGITSTTWARLPRNPGGGATRRSPRRVWSTSMRRSPRIQSSGRGCSTP
jgi:hypothetical protein